MKKLTDGRRTPSDCNTSHELKRWIAKISIRIPHPVQVMNKILLNENKNKCDIKTLN
jgi:hypothetical protein